MVVRRKRLFSWVGILLGVLALASLLGFPDLDRRRAEATTRRGRRDVTSHASPAAIQHVGRASELDPKYAEAYDGRGVAYLNQGHTERAIADLNEAIRLDPNDALAWQHRGAAYARAGDPDRAL